MSTLYPFQIQQAEAAVQVEARRALAKICTRCGADQTEQQHAHFLLLAYWPELIELCAYARQDANEYRLKILHILRRCRARGGVHGTRTEEVLG
ncbi:MAG: hypothetical protein PHE17_20845 [Thiothrix sp.]|uniref:hypothetical protein n=1 Tax=Thiothrix sp. TaxID=1032 RepID=UPI002622AF82|nr:hypothetical protein [Thiothrix sp.]MDD5395479.1 hypothetical protein [Thiothrix sp.]